MAKKSALRSSVAISALLAFGFYAPAFANPDGGVVSGGSATITTNGKTLDINQTSDKAVIDWRSFNIGVDETTAFHQLSSSSIALNRVNDVNPSQILGQLTANGKVILINPNGVFFGKDSHVDVSGLVATTANISNSDFMSGNMKFSTPSNNPDAAIVNQGTITAKEAGLVGFVAPHVENNGVISAKLGKVTLASGDNFTLDMAGDDLITVAVNGDLKQQLASNTGLIKADGGTVTLTAAAARTVVDSVVNNSGVISANSFEQHNGKIVLYAEGSNAVKGNVAADKQKKTGSSTVINSGVLDASGYTAGEKGGTIEVLGDNVGILNGSLIDASGDKGGGTIRIGGDYHGEGVTPTALNTFVDTYTLIYNDAMTEGNGGRTTIWSDSATDFYGNIYSRGGAVSGNGGFTETSGHGYLDAQGYVDLTAANGEKGTYLLDPTDITIYGNVDPTFVSTDGTINLAANLKLWLDASDTNKVNLTYNSLGTTASGTSGNNTITVSSNSGLAVGARIRLGGAGSVTAASTLGADTYTITNISGTTVTLSSNLTTNYTTSSVYQGYVSQVTDKSGQGNNAVEATAADMPLWISNAQNGLGTIRFDGSNDYLSTGSITLSPVMSGFYVYNTSDNRSFNILAEQSADVNSNNGFYFIPHGGAHFATRGAGGIEAYDLSGVSLNDGVWHIVDNIGDGTFAGNAGYVDGKSYAKGTTYFNSNPGTGTTSAPIYIGSRGGSSLFLAGDISEIPIYNTNLSTAGRNLVEQYQSAKWGIALTPPGTGATEVAKATASDGYSVFTTRYLEHLSQSADISLQASHDITFDLKGDTLALAADRNLTLNAGHDIKTTAGSTGTISTSRIGTGGNIMMTAGNDIDIRNIYLSSGNGDVTLNATGNAYVNAINSGTGSVNIAGNNVTLYGGGLANPTSLVTYLNFNEGSGTSAADDSGTNTGTLTNGPNWSSSTPGVLTGDTSSLSFDGSNDYVSVSNSGSLDITGAMTLSAWVKGTNVSQYNHIISRVGSTGATSRWGLITEQSTGKAAIEVYKGNNSNLTVGTTNVLDGSWHLITGVNDGTNLKIYVDGVLQTSEAKGGTTDSNASSVDIGARAITGAPSQFFNGNIDEVRIYNSALTANEIMSLDSAPPTWHTGTLNITAAQNISFDLKGDTITAAAGKNVTLSAGNNISNASAGAITTSQNAGSGGNINMTTAGTGAVNLDSSFILNPGKQLSVSTSGGNISLGHALVLGGNSTFNAGAGTATFGGTINGGYDLTATAGTLNFGGALGGTTPLGAVSLTSANTLTLPAITATSISATTSGGTADINGPSGLTLTTSGVGGIILNSAHDINFSRTALNSSSGNGTDSITAVNNIYLNSINSGTGSVNIAGNNVTLYGGGLADPTALVAYYKFDEGSGTTVIDYSGNGNNGTIDNGGGYSTNVSGNLTHSQYSLSLDGNNDNVSIPDSNSLDLTNGFTFTLWMKSNGAQSNNYLLSKRDNSLGDNVYSVVYGYSPSNTQFYASGNAYGYPGSNSNISVPDTNWHQITYTYNGSTFSTYKDGALVGSTNLAANLVASNSALLLGAFNEASGHTFNGLMDDVRIYNKAISANDVASLYTGTPQWNTGNLTVNAASNLTLDLKGDTITSAAGKNISFTSGNDITNNTIGTITATQNAGSGGDITLHSGATGNMHTGNLGLNAGGQINLIAGGGLDIGTINGALTAQAGGFLITSGAINTNGHALSLTADSDSSNDGFLSINNTITTGNGDATLRASQITFNSTLDAGTGTVIVKPTTAKAVRIGGAVINNDDATYFDISATELGRIKAGTLSIGDAGLASPITIAGDIDLSGGAGGFGAYNMIFNTAGTFDSSGHTINLGRDALLFDGVNDYVNVSSVPLGTVHTAAGWVKFNTTNPIQGIFGGGGSDYLLFAYNGDLYYSQPGNAFTLIAHYVINNTDWHYYAVTRNGTAVSVYVDGTLLGSANIGSNNADTFGALGIWTGDGAKDMYSLNGMMDDARVYDRTLSGAEINALYNNGAGTVLTGSEAGLVAGYDFSEGSGTILHDITGNHNGTLVNGPLWTSAKDFTVNASGAVNVGSINGGGSHINIHGSDVTLYGDLTANGSGTLNINATHDLLSGADGSAYAETLVMNAGDNIYLSTDYDLNAGAGGVRLNSVHGIAIYGSGDITTSGGAIILDANDTDSGDGPIYLAAGTNLTSNGGAITLGGGNNILTGYAIGDSVDQLGAQIASGSISAGGGDIIIRGKGWSDTTAASPVGFYDYDSPITTTGSGKIDITGIGGMGDSYGNYGVFLSGSGLLNVSTVNGAINITGTGGNGAGSGNYGFYLDSGTISSVNGKITIAGTAGDGAGSDDTGIWLYDHAFVSTTGTGDIEITGIGGVGADGVTATPNVGVAIAATADVNSVDGNITLVGTGKGAGTTNYGIWLAGDSDIGTTGAGNIAMSGSGSNSSAGILSDNTWGPGANNISTATAPANITLTSTGTSIFDTSLAGINAAGGIVALTSGGAMILGNVSGGSVLAHSTGATSDLTIASGSTISATNSGTAITLVAGRNFINNSNSSALDASAGRWLIYSTNPSADTTGSLANDFRRFSCAYGGSCPTLGTGNGFLYTYTPMLTATPNALSAITYGDAAPSLTGYAYTLSGYLGSDSGADSVTGSLNGATTYAQGSNAGTYNINYSSGSLASAMGYGFNTANNASGFTVSKRSLAISADAKTKTYGDVDPTLTYQLTSGSLYNTDAITGSLSRAAGENVATYAISQNTLTAGNNYNITYTGANLVIGKANLIVTATAGQNKTYGDADPSSYAYTYSGLVNGDSSALFTGALSRNAGANAGTYAINQNDLAATGNYTIATYNGANFTINKANLTITADDKTKTVGQVNPAFTALYSPFKYSDDASVISGLVFNTSADINSVAGNYSIVPSGATAANYNIAFVNGNLAVTGVVNNTPDPIVPEPLPDAVLKTITTPSTVGNPATTYDYSNSAAVDTNYGDIKTTVTVPSAKYNPLENNYLMTITPELRQEIDSPYL